MKSSADSGEYGFTQVRRNEEGKLICDSSQIGDFSLSDMTNVIALARNRYARMIARFEAENGSA